MSEPVFFRRGRGFTVDEIAIMTGAQRPAGALTERRIFDVAAVDRAGPDDLVFVENSANAAALRTSQAGACLLTTEFVALAPARMVALAVEDPYRAFVGVAAALYPQALRPSSLYEMQGLATSALVHPSARLEAGVTVDPAAVVGPRAEIGAGTLIGPMAVIGPDVRIGRNCSVGAGVSLTNSLLGDRVVIRAGCRIGEAGFAHGDGTEDHGPQLGRVIIQDNVEIGANSTIDRGRFRDTVIGEFTVVDTLVRIAADVMIGRYCAIMRGRDEHAMVAGGSEAADDLTIGDRTRIAASTVAAAKIAVAGRRAEQQETSERAR